MFYFCSKAPSTSVNLQKIPTLQSLAKRAADTEDGKEEEKEIKEDDEKEEGEEPKKKKRKTENGHDNEVLVNGSASPPPADGSGLTLNGTQNGPSKGGSPAYGTSSSGMLPHMCKAFPYHFSLSPILSNAGMCALWMSFRATSGTFIPLVYAIFFIFYFFYTAQACGVREVHALGL